MTTHDRRPQAAVPAGTGAERQLAEQDADIRPPAGQRPDRRATRGNPPLEPVDLERGREVLERVSGH